MATNRSRGRGMEEYIPCLLMKPSLRLRIHTSQLQSCFPAVSSEIVFPGGNLIFSTTLTERITRYTLQAQSSSKWGRCPHLEFLQKGGMLLVIKHKLVDIFSTVSFIAIISSVILYFKKGRKYKSEFLMGTVLKFV